MSQARCRNSLGLWRARVRLSCDACPVRMYVTSVATTAYPIPVTGVRATSGVMSADYATRMAQFDTLSATVNDARGSTSEAQRVEAYQALQAMSSGGQLAGIDPERRKVLDQAIFDSDIGKRAQAWVATSSRRSTPPARPAVRAPRCKRSQTASTTCRRPTRTCCSGRRSTSLTAPGPSPMRTPRPGGRTSTPRPASSPS